MTIETDRDEKSRGNTCQNQEPRKHFPTVAKIITNIFLGRIVCVCVCVCLCVCVCVYVYVCVCVYVCCKYQESVTPLHASRQCLESFCPPYRDWVILTLLPQLCTSTHQGYKLTPTLPVTNIYGASTSWTLHKLTGASRESRHANPITLYLTFWACV